MRTPTIAGMWLDDIDVGGRGVVLPAVGPLGRAVRGLRHDLFLSQQGLADIVGVDQSTISRLERGAPNWALFCRILEAVGAEPQLRVDPLKTPAELLGELTDDWLL